MAIAGGARVLAILLVCLELAFCEAQGPENAPAHSPGGVTDAPAHPPGGVAGAPAHPPGSVANAPVGVAYALAHPPGGVADAPAHPPGGVPGAPAHPPSSVADAPGGVAYVPAHPPGGVAGAPAHPPGSVADAPGGVADAPDGVADAATYLLNTLADVRGHPQAVADTFAHSLTATKLKGRNYDIPDPSEKIFNVLQFGAKSDGRKDCAQSFIKAWRATCDFKGRSRLVIPGGTFVLSQVVFGGPCSGPGPKIVQVIGTLKATTDISEYSSPEWFLFESITGLVVTGRGTFDGRGDAVWKYNDCKNNQNCVQLPSNIKFRKVTDGIIRGVTSLNSKGKHLFITECEKMRVLRIHITAPGDSPNTDGIHISNSNNVRVARTAIATGDDCIAIIAGATNVMVNKLTCGPGHGISVGSLGKYPNERDVRGITVKDCTFTGTDNGVRIKTWAGSPPSAASSMLFQNLIMNDVRFPIIIDQDYCSATSCSSKGPSHVKISNVHYINIRGTSTTAIPVKLMCSKQFPCQDVQLVDIDLKYKGAATSTCDNAKVRYSGKQNPPPCK